MDTIDLIQLQIELEYNLTPDGLLVPLPDSSEQARYIVYVYANGFVSYYRHDLPASIRTSLAQLDPILAFMDPKRIKRILEEHQPCQSFAMYKSYYFTRPPQPDEFPDVTNRDGRFTISVQGQAVSWAWSERSNERCAEVAVETLPAFRRRGYARQVTAAWAHAVLRTGRVAFYSHAIDNLPSQRLALDLGMDKFAMCIAYE